MFLRAIGLDRSQPSEQANEVSRYNPPGKRGDSKLATETTASETHDESEGNNGWSTPPKHDLHDEVPLKTIHVQKEYEQHVVTGPESDGWVDGRRKSWYP